MTQRDIRDIAAYWGSPCTFDFEVEVIEDTNILYSETINHHVLGAIFDNPHKGNRFTNFKLQLRPISALTDEEVIKCVEIMDGERVVIFHKPNIRRSSDFILFTHGNGRPVYTRTTELIENDGIIGRCNPKLIEIVAYLQSIAIYVPGTISEEYVNLVE